jgi:hypothetical protein
VDPCCSSFASTWVHSRCFGGSVLLILCEHMGSFPVFWWIRVAHPLRAHGFIPGVLVDPCCSSFASTWVHSRFFFLNTCCSSLFCTPSFCVLFRILPVSVDSHYLFGPSIFSNVYLLFDAIRMMSVLY